MSWCRERGYASLPAAPVAVAAYLAERAETVRPATVRLAAAAIGDRHRQNSLPNPIDTDGVKIVLSGLARQGQAGAQKQAKGISREDLAAIRATACRPRAGRGGRTESKAQARARGRTDIALCVVMFDGMLRRSEAAALTWADISRAADGSGRLTVRRSKTDPEGAGKVLWISPGTVAALNAVRGEDDGDTDSVFGLSGQQISRRIAAACEAAGLGKGYTGHSLRVGAAQALAGANISLAAIMENGRWQSSRMPARYTRHAAAAQSAMAKLYGHNGQ
ncbi:MAG: tyrosine-type recombinase/integrase [Caldilineaceae bacterium]|nr:tyrosine-type recombinase/integrase [Caldilineaceae bacterium]